MPNQKRKDSLSNYCDFKFGKSDNSTAYNATENQFHCSLCDYNFKHKQSLKRHLLVHSGEKSFQCFHCDYSSNFKSNLKTHLLIHLGEKPFKCSHCDNHTESTEMVSVLCE